MSKIGTTELILILAIALLILGPTVLPKFGKAMGKTIAGFKKGVDEADFEPDEEPAEQKSKKSKSTKSEDEATAGKTKKKKVVEVEADDDADDDEEEEVVVVKKKKTKVGEVEEGEE
jgi:TatA/E family protein of Tat protein translocase